MKRSWGLRCAALCGLVGLPLVAAAQTPAALAPELVTDRPDQTESAETVPLGAVQVETGWLRVEGDAVDRGGRSDEIGGALVRVGLAESWELRLGWGGWIEERGASGAADVSIGGKWRLGRSDSGATTVALLASTSVPVGAAEFSSEAFDPELRLAIAHEISRRLAVAWNAGVAVESVVDGRGQRHAESYFLATATMAFSVAPRVGVFVELFGEGGGSRGGSLSVSGDAGVTLLVRDSLQLDLAFGTGLSSAAPKRFIGAGVSIRLPG